ncbi:serine/threonine protein kinase [Dietzia sp. UCD-THP]|uniref:ATP-binding protein n=1 Tax=Dietzia sp. UCD-THP TaxID=1292020 RepID=UPI000363CD70|nr:ATP-binding protein [Dietzia sp. UCD-THP]EYT61718.1 serine/threonine protein kinase [Dietzia sp. UCD-THP]
MATDQRRELTLTTGEGTLDRVLDEIGEMLSAGQVEEDARLRFEISVAEIGANIIEHAGDGSPVQLNLVLEVTPDRLEARFTDNGSPARVDLRAVQMPDVFADRGRGLAIALEALDELEYRRRGGENVWRLACYREREAGQPEDDDEVSGPGR